MHCHSLLLSPEALAPAAFCCRCHHRLPASSASVLLSVPLPATDGYRFGPRHSRIILPEPHAFRAFTAELSRIAAFNFRREPVACTSQSLPHQHWPSGKGKKPLALRDPATNFALGEISTVRPFALATALLVVSLLGWSVGLTPSPEYVYFRAFSRQGRPCRLPDMTMAPYWDLRQRDFHPQVQQLASLQLPSTHRSPCRAGRGLGMLGARRTSWREPMPGDRVGGGVTPASSHTTVRTVPYTAVHGARRKRRARRGS